jgi:uncharacterized protein YlxW (UPF0749 family)
MPRRALESTEGTRTKHRPRLGSMSTSLLEHLLTDHLDAGYAEAAARRGEVGGGGPRPTRSRGAQLALAAGLLLVGFLLAAAYRSTAQQAPDSERARQALVRDVESGTARSDALQRSAEALAAQLVRERDAALAAGETGDQVSGQLRALELGAAQVSVRGPGVSVVVGDAAPHQQVDPATGEPLTVPPDDSGRLRDRDLQSVVNALWAAGAEAVAVNGERMAPTTTIRAAGEAILVDLLPVSSPYTIEAIGDPDTLLPRFADSGAARRYQSLSSVYGIRFEVRRAALLELRAGTGADLRYARPVEPAQPSGSATQPSDSTRRGAPSSSGGSPVSGGGS